MKKQRLILILVSAVLLVALAVGAVFLVKHFTPDAQAGSKTVTFVVIKEDKSEKSFTLHTDAAYLADALVEVGVLSAKEDSGMYTVIDGIEAKWDPDKAWWCITKNGEMCSVGMNEQVIADGDHFEATYTIG